MEIKRNFIMKKMSIFIIIIALLILISGIYLKQQNKQLTNMTSKESSESRIITEDTISPQIIPEEFKSIVLNEQSTKKLQDTYKVETIYDCSYASSETEYNILSLTTYAKSIIVFMQDTNTGWNLEKGDVLKISFQIKAEEENKDIQVGLISNEEYEDPISFKATPKDENWLYTTTINIKEDAVYYPYLLNVSQESNVAKEFLVQK